MATPFDQAAARYDVEFTDTTTGRAQREAVWRFLSAEILRQKPDYVLELNCGTGEDALWLAQQGCRVFATDSSSAMIDQAKSKTIGFSAKNTPEFAILSIQDLSKESLSGRQPELVFSNFGGLNCLSPVALEDLNRVLRDLLPPGGRFIAVVMGRFCGWESLYYLLKLRFKTAFRRLSQKPLAAPLGPGNEVLTWYYGPKEFAALFPDLSCEAIRPVGFWLPPSYLDPLFKKIPFLLKLLKALEKKFHPAFLANGADHFWISMRR